MNRVSIVGPSGSGKSTLARRLGATLGLPATELDAIHHLPDWTPIEPAEFERRLDSVTAGDRWVIDGNYRLVVHEGVVWRRADTVVWLDLPRSTVTRQVTQRTLRRLVRREVLWNGNRERWSSLFRRDPERSIIRWAWTTHAQVAARYEALMDDQRHRHLEFVRLRSRREVEEWLETLA